MNEKPEGTSVQVEIYDREFTLVTTGDPDRLKALCASLDQKMREVTATTGSVDTLKVAILAALGLADELLRLREELKKLDDAIGRRSQACVALLDRIIS